MGFFDDEDKSVDWAECKECGGEFNPAELKNGVCTDCQNDHDKKPASFFSEGCETTEMNEAEDPDFMLHDMEDADLTADDEDPDMELHTEAECMEESKEFSKFMDMIVLSEHKHRRTNAEITPTQKRVQKYSENHGNNIKIKG